MPKKDYLNFDIAASIRLAGVDAGHNPWSTRFNRLDWSRWSRRRLL